MRTVFTKSEIQRWQRKLTKNAFYLYGINKHKCRIIERRIVGDDLFMLCEFGDEVVMLVFWLLYPNCIPEDKFFGRLTDAKRAFRKRVSEANGMLKTKGAS